MRNAVLFGLLLTASVASHAQAQSTCGTGVVSEVRWPLANWYESCGFNVTCADLHHMGVDGTDDPNRGPATVGTPVLAPCTGVVKDASKHDGYGGTVIVECLTAQGCVSLLSGHMYPPRTSLNTSVIPAGQELQVQPGQTVIIGATVGYLAPRGLNAGSDQVATSGRYSPHVHVTARLGPYRSFNYEDCMGKFTCRRRNPQTGQYYVDDAGNIRWDFECSFWSYGAYPAGCYNSELLSGYINPNDLVGSNQSARATPATHHLCTGGLWNSGPPNYVVTCNQVPANANYPAAAVFYAGEDIILNARYENVYGSAYLRVYVERDGLPFTNFTHDPGPWDYSNDPHTAHVTPIIPYNPFYPTGTFRFFICLDLVGDGVEVTESTCKARPDFNVAAVLLPSTRPANTITTASANCVPEICANGLDDDCDGQIDTVDNDCQTPLPPISTPGPSDSTAGSDSVAEGQWDYFSTEINSTEIERLAVTISDLSADIDLFVRHGQLPTRIEANCVSVLGGTATDRCEITDPTTGTWHIGVYGFEAGRYTLRIETARRGYCTASAWRCSDWFPTHCPPWGQRSRNCTLVNTSCLHPELVRPLEVEPCPPPPCQPAWAYRLGGAPRDRAPEVEVSDLNCPSTLGAWRYTTPLPSPRVGMGCTEAGGCIVCTGGFEPQVGQAADVFIGCPDAQGEITLWDMSPYHLPIAMSYHHAWKWQDKVCVMEYHRTKVYCAPFEQNAKQFTEMWRLAEGYGYEGTRSDKGLAIFGDELCVVGGWDGSRALTDTQCTTMWWEWNQVNLRPWQPRASLPIQRYAGNLTQAHDTMIWTGGVSNANATDMTGRTFLLPLDPSRTDAPWVEGPMFAPGVYNHTVFVHDHRVYLVDGYGPNGFVPNVHTAVFLGPTVLSPWQPAASLNQPAASFSVVIIKQPAAAVAVAPAAATAPSHDAGTTAETVAVDAGTALTDASIADANNTAETETASPDPATAFVVVSGSPRPMARSVLLVPINSNGTVGEPQVAPPLPVERTSAGIVGIDSCVIVAGGVEPGVGSTNTTYTARVTRDLAAMVWYDGPHLPRAVGYQQMFSHGNLVCMVDGLATRVYCAAVDLTTCHLADSWYEAQGQGFTGARYLESTAVCAPGKVCISGGWRDYYGPLQDVQVGSFSRQGDRLVFDSWVTPTALPMAINDHTFLVEGDTAFMIGGADDAYANNTFGAVQLAMVNAEAQFGPWNAGPTLMPARRGQTAHRVGRRLYVIGGITGNGEYLPDIQMADIPGRGQLGPFTQVGQLPSGRGGHASAVVTLPP